MKEGRTKKLMERRKEQSDNKEIGRKEGRKVHYFERSKKQFEQQKKIKKEK